jgi:hypothetical protein
MTTDELPQASTLPAEIPPTDQLLSIIERVAMSPNADIAKLEKMLEMQERVLARNARMAFASDLARMQADMPEISQNGAIVHNGRAISKYAKFEDINEAVKPVLQKHGFAVSFRIKQPEGKIEVTAILSHRDGHSEETSMLLPADTSGAKNAVQAQGSSVAYGKRYAMCALLNITSRGEDDDGAATDKIDTEQAATLDTLIVNTGADRKAFLGYFKVDDIRNLKASQYHDALGMLNKKAKKASAA